MCVCVCVRQRVGKVMCIYKLIQTVLIVMLFLTELLLHVHETIVSYVILMDRDTCINSYKLKDKLKKYTSLP